MHMGIGTVSARISSVETVWKVMANLTHLPLTWRKGGLALIKSDWLGAEPLRSLWRRENCLPPLEIETQFLGSRACSRVIVSNELSQLR